jgi:hypothetical protein
MAVPIFGLYRFRPRTIAFRCDYCRHCQKEALAVAVRTFAWLHLYFIPLLPMGFETKWYCTACYGDPHAGQGTPRPIRILISALLLPLAIYCWLVLLVPSFSERGGIGFWITGITTTLLFAMSAVWSSKGKFDSGLQNVTPYSSQKCPLCDDVLMQDYEGAKCVDCGAEHRPLKQA